MIVTVIGTITMTRIPILTMMDSRDKLLFIEYDSEYVCFAKFVSFLRKT